MHIPLTMKLPPNYTFKCATACLFTLSPPENLSLCIKNQQMQFVNHHNYTTSLHVLQLKGSGESNHVIASTCILDEYTMTANHV